jgi:hypothetical protein
MKPMTKIVVMEAKQAIVATCVVEVVFEVSTVLGSMGIY